MQHRAFYVKNYYVVFAVVQLVEALRYKPEKVAGSIPDGVIGIFH